MTLVKFNRKPLDTGFNNFMDDFFSEFPVYFKNGQKQVPVNVREDEKAYILDIVAPGFDKSDFKISIDQNILTIEAERKNEVKEENEKVIRREYSYQSFKRSFTLDEKMDSENIDAKYANGILTLNLPKKAEVKPSVKQISIQ